MNRRRLFGLMCLVCSPALLGAIAEEPTDETVYKALRLHKFGRLEGNLDGSLDRLSGGVHLTLVAEKADDNLEIKALTVELSYSDDDNKTLTIIVFEGDVRFTHQKGTVLAEKVTIDLETMEALFTGNPKADIPPIHGAEVEWIRMNLDTNDVVAGPGKVREFRFRDEDDARGLANPGAANP